MTGLAIVGPDYGTENTLDGKGADVAVQALKSMALIFMAMRLIIACQYLVVTYWFRRYSKARRVLLIHVGVSFSTAMLFLGLSFAINSNNLRTVAAVWYPIILFETLMCFVIASRVEFMNFRKTSIVERLGLLTLIILGEGVIGICDSISRVGIDHSFSSDVIGMIICAIVIIYFIWMLYYDQTETEHVGTLCQHIWMICHFPFHVAALLTVEGISQFSVWRKVVDLISPYVSSMENYPSDIHGADLAVYFNNTVQALYSRFSGSTVEQPDLAAYFDVFSDPTTSSDERFVAGSNITYAGIVFVCENFEIEPPESTSASAADPVQSFEQIYTSYTVVFIYFFAAAGLTLIFLALLFFLGRHERVRGDYLLIVIRILVGLGLSFLTFMALPSDILSGDIDTFIGSAWMLPTVAICYVFIVLFENLLLYFTRRVVLGREKKLGDYASVIPGRSRVKSDLHCDHTTVVEKGYKYLKAVKDCEDDVRKLMLETNILCGIIDRLAKLAEDNEDSEDNEGYHTSNGSSPSYLPIPLADKIFIAGKSEYVIACQKSLNEIHDILKRFETKAWKHNAAADTDVFAEGQPRKKRNIMVVLSPVDLKWPLSKSRTLELIQVLERHKSTCILALSMNEISSMRNVLDQMSVIKDHILEMRAEHKTILQLSMTKEQTKVSKEMQIWFSPTNPERNHQAACDLYQSGTGLWIYDLPEYNKWIQGRNTALWIYGIPDAGKTILASLIIRTVSLYVLGSLIMQLALQNESAFQEVRNYYTECRLHGRLSNQTNATALAELLQSISRKFEEVTIVIDGLDECGSVIEDPPISRPQFVSIMSTLHDSALGTIRILIMSRSEADIRTGLSDFPSISIAAKSQDLELYVHAKASSLSIRDKELRAEIIQTLINRADGMFQWVRCQIDYLGLLPSDRERRNALKELPPTLPAIYIRILERLDITYPRQTQLYIQRILIWLTLANLRLASLTHPISIEEDTCRFDTEAIPDMAEISKWCSSLIRIDLKRKEIALSHFTYAVSSASKSFS
ncbi:hypothetical protein MMC18_001763 [Xylographa bjoerkii]|nr:hypothetical protein [Xylographa bjoerkii]